VLTGRATPGSPEVPIEAVTVNGHPVDMLDAAGNFFALLHVESGPMTLTVEATDAWGQSATASVTLIGVEPPAGGFAFDQAYDTTAAGRLTYEGTFLNRQTQTLHAAMRLINTGAAPLRADVLAVFDQLSPLDVSLTAAEGTTPEHALVVPPSGDDDLPPEKQPESVDPKLPPEEQPGKQPDTSTPNPKDPPAPTIPDPVPSNRQVPADCPYVTFDASSFDAASVSPAGVLLPAETSLAVPVRFANPRYARFEFAVTLLAVGNRPPEFNSLPVPDAAIGRPYRYGAAASDTDGDVVTYRLSAGPDFLLVDPYTGLVSGTPGASDVGTHQVELIADDGYGGSARQTFPLQVWETLPNRPPLFQTVPIAQVAAGADYTYASRADDPDGDVLQYTLDTGPSGMTVDEATGVVRYPQAAAGTHTVSLRVADGRGGQAQQTFVLTVGDGTPNVAPQFVSSPPVRGAAGQLYQYQPGIVDPDGGPPQFSLTQAPAGMTIDAATGLVRWQPTAQQTGLQAATLRVTDQHGGAAAQHWAIDVTSTAINRPPAFVERAFNPFVTVDQPAAIPIQAQDPEGDTLRYELLSAPAGMTLSILLPDEGQGDGTVLTWTPTAADLGWHRVVVRAYDPLDAFAQQTVYLEVRRPNTPPRFTSEPLTTGTAGAVYRHLAAAEDDEDTVTFGIIQSPPGLTIDPATGLLFWRSTPTDAGPHAVTVRATDDRGLWTDQPFTLQLLPDAEPPAVRVSLSHNPICLQNGTDASLLSCASSPPSLLGGTAILPYCGATASDTPPPSLLGGADDSLACGTITSTVIVQVHAVDNVALAGATLSLDGTLLPPEAWWRYEFAPPAPGLYTFTATATDTAGNVGTATTALRVFDPADTTPPRVEITSPAAGDVITYLTDITGTVTDEHLEFYRLQYALAGSEQWTTFFDSAVERGVPHPDGGVTDGLLGVFDPTLLQRDDYDLRVVAQDINGLTTIVQLGLPVSVEAQAVLGNFRLDFTDLSIPLAGIPIQIHRTYDTLNAARSGDFGYGWTLGIAQANVRESVRVSEAERSGITAIFGAAPFRPGTRVYLTNPAGRRVGFTFDPVPEGGVLGTIWRPRFTPDPGVYDQLTVADLPLSQRDDGTFAHYPVNLPYNPSQYSLTTKDGHTYRYDQFTGLLDVTDRNQNVLTYTADGITSSTGAAIRFHRDAQDRIVAIEDPDGNTIAYTYNTAGDLVAVTNQTGEVTTYFYRSDRPHYFDRYVCPSCVPMVRTEYDQAGRVVSTYDVLGNPVTQSYDVANNTEVIGDRLGNETTLTFDSRGNIVSETNSLGHTVQYQYDARDNLVGVTNARGYESRFDYDARGNVTGSTDALGNTYSAIFNEFNQIAVATDPLGRTAVYRYDARGNLVELVNAAGDSSFLDHDVHGRVVSITDNRGNTTTFEYGTGGLPVRATNADGSTRQFQYNTFGLVTSYADETGQATTFRYDASGKVLSATDPLGAVTQFTYDASRLVAITDPLGRVQRFEHDEAQRPVRLLDAAGGLTQFAYDANDRRTAVSDPLGRTNLVQYDAVGRIVSRTEGAPGSGVVFDGNLRATESALPENDSRPLANARPLPSAPSARTTLYEYDAAGNLIAATDALGRVTRYEYDPLDRLTRVVDPAGNQTTFTYDSLGNLLTTTDPLDRTTRYEYDALSRLVRVTDALGSQWCYAYDGEGNLIARTDANGHTAAFAYDSRNQLIAQTDAAGSVTSFAYDDAGRILSWTDALGQTTAYTRDDAGRMLTRTDPLGGIASWTYDLAGNPLTATDEISRTTRYTYDALDRMLSAADPRGSVTRFQYDAVGNLTRLTDPADNVWTFDYDAFDRLAVETDPLGQARTYEYDAADNLVLRTDRNGHQTVFAYDELDQLVTETWYDSGIVANTLTFAYDPIGNLMSAADAHSRYAYTYDALNRVLTTDNASTPSAPHVVLSFAYDPVGNLLSVRDNVGVEQISTYDARSLLTSRTWQGSGIDAVRAEFTYNALGQAVELDRFAGATAASPLVGRTTYAYDAKARLTDIAHRTAADAVLADYDYVRDLADQLIQETHHGQTSRYTYDPAGQLTAAEHSLQPDESYTYDPNGNRLESTIGGTTTSYQPGPANRLLSDGTFQYQYDREGNLTRKTETATGTVTDYVYDHRNRLVQVQEQSVGGIILRELTYTYDVFDRRIAQSIDDDGPGGAPPQVTHFAYHGAHVWSDHDAAGNVTARYLFADNLDQILARHRPGEGTAWYLTDHLGTVRDITDATGAVINHVAYDAFGQILSQTAPEFGDRYTYTAREYDPALGQYYYRARTYDPRAGRFTAEDPLRFAAGDPNLYRYVGNSPLNWTDPWGYAAVAENSAILDFGPVLAILRNPFTPCVIVTFMYSAGVTIGMDYILTPLFGPPNEAEIAAGFTLDFVFAAISCHLFPPAALGNATFGAVAVSLMAVLARATAVATASKVVTLATSHVFAYATTGGGPSSLAASSGSDGAAEAANTGVVARIRGKLNLYPEILDPRTGRNIPFPSAITERIPKSLRVPWTRFERAEFIAEWHRRRYPKPTGGWDKYDIHHIQPREFGGTNDFWNLVPVERTTHQELFNAFWRDFLGF
jgi:RHS repeat-associated protein